MREEKKVLLGLSSQELQQYACELGMPKFTGKQLYDWIYVKGAEEFEYMTNLSKHNRQLLSEHATVGREAPVNVAISKDGTKKYLFQVGPSRYVEAVFIPEGERATLCISSQIGCKMNCYFCMTGKQGFGGQLTAAQILNQYYSIPEWKALTNIVFMGMGEPLDNIDNVLRAIHRLTEPQGNGWSPKRITLSTVGHIKNLKRFLDECDCHLAISLHAPIPEERAAIIPLEKTMPIEELFPLLRQYDFSGQRRLTFEYIVFSGFNDEWRHVDALERLLKGLPARLNLIRYHRIPGVTLPATDPLRIENFAKRLNERKIPTTIRTSRGEDIEAACGMLSTKEQDKINKQSFSI